MRNTGFIASGYDPHDIIIDAPSENLPSEYSYDPYIRFVKDQGYTSMCVPYSISYAIELLNECNNRLIKMDVEDIYNQRTNEGEGMMIREALSIMKNNGYKFDEGHDKILQYGRLTSERSIKWSLIANGPCIMALPVRSANSSFWRGNEDRGGHAICCIGYNEYGFVLLNTWGRSWGEFGQCILPYDEINTIIECWGIIS